MLPAGLTSDARRMDAEAVSRGVPSLLLMENAAFSLYEAVNELLARDQFDAVIVFAGKGGNGGDGMALLRILTERGCRTPLGLVPLFSSNDLSGDAATNFRLLPSSVKVLRSYRSLSGKILFVDALLGTGLSSNLSAPLLAAVRFINTYPRKKVVAADVPTGLSGDTGETLPEAVKADITVSFGLVKAGLFLAAGPDHAGEVRLGSIGVPARQTSCAVLEERDFVPPEMPPSAHKRTNGRLLVIGGDPSKIGASFIAAEAFLSVGGGLATVAVPDRALLRLAGRYPAVMLITPNEAMMRPEQWDVIICGPGLRHLSDDLTRFLISAPARLILDAGIFDYLDRSLLKKFSRREAVFTPHPGELSRTAARLGITGSWYEQVTRFPLSTRHVLYAKNASSWIRNRNRTVILPHGARGLSFGGTGDALAGIIAAYAGRKSDLFQAAINGALLHRRAGLLLETELSPTFHRISTLLYLAGKSTRHFEEQRQR